MNSRKNSINKWSELKYLTNFKNENQMRFKLIVFKVKRTKKNICLNVGKPFSKTKYNI